jgi:hypothetical protein
VLPKEGGDKVILYLLFALIISIAASLILKRIHLPWVWCIVVGIICFAGLVWWGMQFVKNMDSPPPGSKEITQEELNRAAGIE